MIPVLIDFDGVIKLGNDIAHDAKDFLDLISSKNIPACILSNSTLRTSDLMKDFLKRKGIDLKIPALTAFDATVEYAKKNHRKVKVYCRDYLIHHFKDLITESSPEAVIVGDIGEKWNFQVLNEIFKYVMDGSELITMHKNKFWYPDGNLVLDAGAFVNAIEFASGKTAKVIGKPSPLFFATALEKIEQNQKSDFYMIGDDLDNDVLAAQNIGGKGILMLTGKTKSEDIKNKRPDFVFNSLTDVINKILK